MNEITNMKAFLNAAERRLDAMFPGFFNTTTKRNHYVDFGYPEQVTFAQLWQMYRRNSAANSAVDKTVLKTWESNPYFQIGDKTSKETPREKEFNDHLNKIRFWQTISEVDRRSLVGQYSAAIFRFADNKKMREPVDSVPGGLDGLVEIIPAWEGQLEVATWDTDEMSATYGKPLMFNFNEASFDNKSESARQFEVHPDRVLIWSRDGTVHGQSPLEPGYNDLVTLEKVVGAGGEGFWKNAKSAPILTIDKEARIEAMAKAMGVTPDKLADKMDEQVKDYNRGFDAMLLLQGIDSKTLSVTLPSPEHFIKGPLELFSASYGIPMKILVGSQSGERASSEDADEWSRTCMARRNGLVIPNLLSIKDRLVDYKILANQDWHLNWPDLTEANSKEKMERADKMSDINSKYVNAGGSDIIFTANEIREAGGHEPRSELDVEFGSEDELDSVE